MRYASIRQRLFNISAQQWHDVPSFITFTDQAFANEEVESTMWYIQ